MNRQDKQKHYNRYGEVDRDLDQQRHHHSDRGRPSFDLDNEEYDQRGGNNNDRQRDNYSNHVRSRAGDQYWQDEDNRFDDRGQYSSSRNYGGMGGFGGAQGFGTSRAGFPGQNPSSREQDRGRYDATSGRGRQPENDRDAQRRDQHQNQRHLYGGYREYRREEDRNQEPDRQARKNQEHSFDYAGHISKGEFSPMLGGNPSQGWYTPAEGGYSRSGGYVGPGGVDRGSRRANYDEDNDTNYGQTFGDDIHYDPTSQDRRYTHVQDQDRRPMEKYGSESRDLDQIRGWHYDARLDAQYGRENKSQNQYGWRNQDRQNRNQDRGR